MSEAKFTPGPWTIGHNSLLGDKCYRSIHAEKSNKHALSEVVWKMEDEEKSPELEANAHLISAAPDMYEALIKAKDLLEPFQDAEWLGCKALDKVNNALAKARG